MTSALAGIRVLEIGGGKALAYAGKLLRDLGAEVIKVEPPSGDPLRGYGPFPDEARDPERSGLFVYLNAGKRGLRLDVHDPAGRDALEPLLDGADAVLHSFRAAEAQQLRLDYATLAAGRPRLIAGAITVFGHSGPYAEWRGYPIHAYAGSGVSYRIGDPAREPLNAPLEGTELHHAGPQLAACVALALLYRDRTGLGQFIDLSSMEIAHVSIWGHTMAQVVYLGHPVLRRRGQQLGGIWGMRRTKDGWLSTHTQISRQWEKFLRAIGDPEWGRDPRIAGLGDPAFVRQLSPEDGAFVERTFREGFDGWLQAHTSDEIWELTKRERISFHPVLTVPQVLESDHAKARGVLVDVPNVAPQLRVPGPPYRLSETPALPPGEPLRLDAEPATAWRSTPPSALDGREPHDIAPLAGLRVLDLGQVWAGPLVGRYLADYGADVIHIRTRSRPPTSPGSTDPDNPLAWEWIYRNRRSLALNFAHREAVDLFRRLTGAVDVVVDNFAPRVLPSLGLDYEALCAANPRLIMVHMPAAGRGGPWSDLVTYAPSLESIYGMKSLNGYPEDRAPMESAAELDPTAAGYATLAIFAALFHRARTGRGQFIEVAQGEASLAGIAEAVIEYTWNGRDMGPQGNTHRVLAPHGSYPTTGEDQWIAIACGSDDEWRALAAVAGRAEWLSDPRFASAARRREHRHALDAAIAAWTRTHDKWALTHELQAAGVAAFPQLDQLEVVADPHLHARRQHFVRDPRFTASDLLNGNPWHLSACPPRLRLPAPELGAHNVDVLGELLGIPESEVRRLEQAGVLE